MVLRVKERRNFIAKEEGLWVGPGGAASVGDTLVGR